MSKILNLAKGRTYSCTTSVDTTIKMSDGSQVYTVNIYAPQGLFVATAETGVIDNDAAVVRQLFYSASASGIGVKPVKLQDGTELNKDNNELAVTGLQVANYVDAHTMMSLVVWESTTPPTVDEAKFNTIYLVPVSDPVHPESDTYDEWVKVTKSDGTVVMEKIGSTALRIDQEVTYGSFNAVSSHAVYNFKNGNFIQAARDSHSPLSYDALNFIDTHGSVGSSIAYNYTLGHEGTDGQTLTPSNANRWFSVKLGSDSNTYIGYYTGARGISTTESLSVALEDIQYVVNNAYIEESASGITGGGSSNYIDERVRAVLSSRTPSRLSSTDVTKALAGTYALREDDILQVDMTGSEIDLSKVVCVQDATAEIWIDVYTSATVKVNTGWTWLETAAPTAALTAGYRYVITIRNDGPIPASGTTSPTGTKVTQHHVVNIAYQEAFPTAS